MANFFRYLPFFLILNFLTLVFRIPAFGQETLNKYIETLPPEITLSFTIQDQEGRILAQMNQAKKVPSASIIKIPLLIYLMDRTEKGKLDLNATYKLKKSDKVGGAGELQFKPDGYPVTYQFLAAEMIRISDNTATNILIRKLGLKKFQKWLHSNGYTTTQLNRFMMDFDAIALGKQNYTSPEEMNRLLLALLNEQLLRQSSSFKVIDLLKNCADDSTLPNLLPEGVEIAHKTGTLDYVRGDAGIIYGKQTLVLTVLVENFPDLEFAEEIIAKIGQIAYLEFAQ
jgi:beta-lactamase class A